jgi:hypothetical protein
MDHLHLRIPPILNSFYAQETVVALRATAMLIGAWCLLSTLEWVSNIKLFGVNGLLSWRILSLRPGLIVRNDTFWDRSVPWILTIRIIAAIALLFVPGAGSECIALVAIIATSWFLAVRTWLATDGSDQIAQIACVGALLIAMGVFFKQSKLSFAGALLVGGQLTLAYFFGGITKLLSAEWRHGRALVGIMGTHSFGHALGARILARSSLLALILCWLVILCETLFPLALFAPPVILLLTLATFLLLHITYAYMMGLNTFVWAFATAYPSFIVLSGLTARAVNLH